MGRWPSGAALEPVPSLPAGVDPTASDPSAAHPALLTDPQVNNFDYEPVDGDGRAVPRAAHIRKANPRSSNPSGGRPDSNRHRILRRGIVYGPELSNCQELWMTWA